MPLIIALLKTLTLKKLIVLIQARLHYRLERHFHTIKTNKYTPFITIEASNRCMLQCPECATGSNELTRAKGDLTLDNFKQIIDEIYPYTTVLNLYMQGEPYLNKSLGAMIAYGKEKGLFISLSTNAQIIPVWQEAHLPQHIIISADGATQANYEKYRVGGSLEKVMTFTKGLSEYKTSHHQQLPYVELQFLVNHYNEDEIAACKALFRGYYNRFVKKSMQIIHPEKGTHFLPEKKALQRNRQHSPFTPACYKMISTTVITQDGSVVPCCMDKDAYYKYGNIAQGSIATINQSEKHRKFHNLTIQKKNQLDLCKNCPFA